MKAMSRFVAALAAVLFVTATTVAPEPARADDGRESSAADGATERRRVRIVLPPRRDAAPAHALATAAESALARALERAFAAARGTPFEALADLLVGAGWTPTRIAHEVVAWVEGRLAPGRSAPAPG